MLRPRFVAVAALAAMLVACGGSTPTPAPGGATPEPGAATTDPGGGGGGGEPTTDPGGGGGSGGGGTGKVTYNVTGPVQKSGELPFFAFGSRFDRAGPAGLALTFTTESGGIFTVSEVSGQHSIGLVDEQHGLSFANCEVYELNINGNNATGRFECSNGIGTNVADGSLLSGVKITGTIDAHG